MMTLVTLLNSRFCCALVSRFENDSLRNYAPPTRMLFTGMCTVVEVVSPVVPFAMVSRAPSDMSIGRGDGIIERYLGIHVLNLMKYPMAP